jgi:hypothetical protein
MKKKCNLKIYLHLKPFLWAVIMIYVSDCKYAEHQATRGGLLFWGVSWGSHPFTIKS